jgi:anti-sigma regulatory factor (Ser/Thr protein kinase)
MSEPKPGLVVRATIDAIELVAQYLDTTLTQASVPMMDATRIQLAVEEAVTNVVTHGYEEGEGDVSVLCTIEGNVVTVIITDSGHAFDPTSIPPADVTADIDHRKIGGLGVHLIRSVMDEISYQRIEDKNQFTMIKQVSDSDIDF